MIIVKLFKELTIEQKKDAKKRFKSPYTGYHYKIAKNGNIAYRERIMRY